MSVSPVRMNTFGIKANILRNPSGLSCAGAAIIWESTVVVVINTLAWWGKCGCSTNGDVQSSWGSGRRYRRVGIGCCRRWKTAVNEMGHGTRPQPLIFCGHFHHQR